MESEKEINQIKKELENHEKRIHTLERANKNRKSNYAIVASSVQKQTTLAEIIRGKSFKSGQEKIAVIVGYYEKIIRKNQIKEVDLKTGWKSGKFDGKYNRNLLNRAIKDGLVRNIDTNIDLSQTGERFFDNFIK